MTFNSLSTNFKVHDSLRNVSHVWSTAYLFLINLSLQEELLAKKRGERTARLANVQQDVQEKLRVLEETYQEKEKAMRARFQQLESRAGCV